jgi:two-component system LytT family response regulator
MKAIIIDDEINCSKSLAVLLQKHCPEIEVITACKDGVEGLDAIQLHSPDIVFLDIHMPGMSGFEMLEKLSTFNFHLVFTTSYDQYALKAFRFSAIDYLLKPIDKSELMRSMEKVRKINKTSSRQVEAFLQRLQHPLQGMNKIGLPTMEGLQMIPVHSIISCESDDNYTILFLNDRKKMVVSCTLKDIEELLHDYSFIRVHRSYLVNLNEIEKYVKGEGGYLVMSDGSNIDVSRSRKEDLLKKLLPRS